MEEKIIIENHKYLKLLSKQFPTIHEASTEIINLEAILNLPKGTEHFLSDVHGEDEAFLHLVKSGSGIIRRKIDDVFSSTITNIEKKKLAILIYYPKEVLKRVSADKTLDSEEQRDWLEVTLHRLVLVLREVSSKYTRSKVRKALPEEFEYIIEELLHHRENDPDKDHHYNQIIRSIIEIGSARSFIIAMSEVIQQLAVDHLHLIGDIYDRGPNPDIIMDKLIDHHSIDIQWGNHDIVWMGAAAGSKLCILNVIRICARYGQLDILEENYGINILPIAKYAMNNFDEVETEFLPKAQNGLLKDELKMSAQINKAATLMLFKLEEEVARRSPEYELENRCLLSKVDFNSMTVTIDDKRQPLLINSLPTVDKVNPSKLKEEEEQVLNKLQNSFLNNARLQKHIAFLFEKGSIYKVHNGNLLYHGCIPLNEDGSYTEMIINQKSYKGKELLDKYEKLLRSSYTNRENNVDEKDTDIFWFLWSGKNSSLFGKHAMKTFERTFIKDTETHIEKKNPYYQYILEEEYCKRFLKDFDLNPETGRIINGHVPVKVSKGESPIKSGGRLIVIDGGLSKAYQDVTGIAGYTLIFNSHGMLLASHEPFTSAKDAYENNVELISELTIVEAAKTRILVGDTDNGIKLKSDINDLKMLLAAYRQGLIKTLLY
jgi:fructose-1,6-bisphosphatase-3